MSERKKIALIGAGQIGGILALLSMYDKLGDVVLYDVATDMPQGKAMDLGHGAPILLSDSKVQGTNDISDIKDADVCVVTAGLPRKPGMSREDLVNTNAAIVKEVAAGIKTHAPNAFVIVITNPLDGMAYLMQRETGFPTQRVVGMAGVLDTARYQTMLARELNVSVTSVSAFVMGAHGDAMVPLRSYTTCNGIPVGQLLSNEKLDEIEAKVRSAGGDIVALLKTGSAFFSTAAAGIEMVKAYLYDRKKVLAASAYCEGQYGAQGIYLGVPIILGGQGVERIVEVECSDDEKAQLQKSISGTTELIKMLS